MDQGAENSSYICYFFQPFGWSEDQQAPSMLTFSPSSESQNEGTAEILFHLINIILLVDVTSPARN